MDTKVNIYKIDLNDIENKEIELVKVLEDHTDNVTSAN